MLFRSSDKYAYKLRWIDALLEWLGPQLDHDAQSGKPGQPLALLGDFNIAPADADVHDPQAWAGQVLCSAAERERFQRLIALGLVDSFRRFEQAPRTFSWWDYRQLGFRRNAGLRIDHILVDEDTASHLTGCRVDREPRKLNQPSDHAPVIANLQVR